MATEQTLPDRASANQDMATSPFQHPSLDSGVIYYDYGSTDYLYQSEDYMTGDIGETPMDSDFIVRSDGTIQKLSSVDFSHAVIFNFSGSADYNISLNSSALLQAGDTLSTARTVAAAFFSLFFLVGLLGNVLVIYTVWRFPGMRRVTYFFLVNLAVTNLIYLLLGLPTITVSYLKMDWPFGDHFCKLDNYVMSVSMAVSILTIMATGFDRYLAVVYPVRSRHIRTRTISLLVILVTWVVSLAVMVPRGMLYATRPWHHDTATPTTLCSRAASAHRLRVDTGLRFGLLYLLPLAVLIACHLRIGYALWTRSVSGSGSRSSGLRTPLRGGSVQRERRPPRLEVGRAIEEAGPASAGEEEAGVRSGSGKACFRYPSFCGPRCMNDTSSANTEDADGKEVPPRVRLGSQPTGQSSASTVTAIKIVFALTTVFALGWLPLHLHYLAIDFGLMDSVFLPQFLNGGTVALLFCFGANALNPILYCVFSSHFRRHFRKALDQCCCVFFKTTNTNVMFMDISSCRNPALATNTTKSRFPEACGRPLLLGRDKQCWVEDIEKGEGSNPDEAIRRRAAPLQPRPASLLCENTDQAQLFHTAVRQGEQLWVTLPGQCPDTPTVTINARGRASSPQGRTLGSTGQPSEASSSSLELQRHLDVSPLSLEKVIQIELSPVVGKTHRHQEGKLAGREIQSQVTAREKIQRFTRRPSSDISVSTAGHPWAWPSNCPGRYDQEAATSASNATNCFSPSGTALAIKSPSEERLVPEHKLHLLAVAEARSGSAERLDSTSTSSGVSTLHSDDSRTRINLTADTTSEASPGQAHTASSGNHEARDSGSSSHSLPKLTVHSIFSRKDGSARNPNKCKQHCYSKDSSTSTTDLGSAVSEQSMANVDISLRPTQNLGRCSATQTQAPGSSLQTCRKLTTLPRQALTSFLDQVNLGPGSQEQHHQQQQQQQQQQHQFHEQEDFSSLSTVDECDSHLCTQTETNNPSLPPVG
ncbi:hypothetical protein EGW08_015768 [Elysia chlorotica]|uniref:G-protein coupled receptors family 1 profile domain-containing protein n=1 Tax=Elysia chlorotica TaxID=188477 RepID=A0A3S0ZDJ4_ELYCH|nr:hypothetical protein EGW08_015768 [Elysia chlorotica]